MPSREKEPGAAGHTGRTLSVAQAWGVSRACLGPAAAGEVSASTISTRRPGSPAVLAPAPPPVGGSAEEGRGPQAVPVSLPLPSGDSDSRQALGGLSFRPKDSCTRPDPFSEPQSPHLCNGLVVLIPSGPFYTLR